MDQQRIDLLIQYILSVAAQGWGDYDDKEVGRIHIIKYVYLADLDFAMRHGGETFTGIPWRFHHFGPWDETLFKRIDPACQAIGGHKRTVADTPYDDFDRWSVDNNRLMDQLSKQLPPAVTFAIDGSFKQFTTDAYDLLDHVYSTIPMRHASPGERLSFNIAAQKYEQQIKENEELKQYQHPELTAKQKKKRKQAFQDLKKKIEARIAEKGKNGRDGFVTPTAPRYDELFWKGQGWLDSLAGEPVRNEKGVLTVSDSIWKSLTRSEPHV